MGKFFMPSDVQVNLRLPIELKEKLHEIAKNNNRSLNNELNERLINSFAQSNNSNQALLIKELDEFLSGYRQIPRLSDIANRLNFALNEVNEIRFANRLNPSLIAYELGFDYAAEMEGWFEGRIEPSFEQLKKLAKLLGCSEEWLLFGLGKPYPVKYAPSTFDVKSFINFCLDTKDTPYEKVTSLYFVLSESSLGELLIIKQFSNRACQVYETTLNLGIESRVGVTGTELRSMFVIAIQALVKSFWQRKTQSFVLEPSSFERIKSGDEHPQKVLFKFNYLNWIDFIYNDSLDSMSFWDGWDSIRSDIIRDIRNSEVLSSEKSLVHSQQHEVFKLLNQS